MTSAQHLSEKAAPKKQKSQADPYWELHDALAKHGYFLTQVTNLKTKDRIHYCTKDFKYSMTLKGRVEDFSTEQLIKTILGTEKP